MNGFFQMIFTLVYLTVRSLRVYNKEKRVI